MPRVTPGAAAPCIDSTGPAAPSAQAIAVAFTQETEPTGTPARCGPGARSSPCRPSARRALLTAGTWLVAPRLASHAAVSAALLAVAVVAALIASGRTAPHTADDRSAERPPRSRPKSSHRRPHTEDLGDDGP